MTAKNIIKNKLLGQHFIHDKNLLNKIVNIAGPLANFNILEIGGGVGTLTKAILAQNPLSLATVEKDERFASYYEELQGCFPQYNFNFIIGDALKFKLADLIKGQGIIIANLPYNIASRLLFNWLQEIQDQNNININNTNTDSDSKPFRIEKLVLMFQKEVAAKLIAKPRTKDYGILSVLTQMTAQVEYMFTIPPKAFHPPPKVESAVVKITPYRNPNYIFNYNNLIAILKTGFSKRRKIISTNLLPLFNNNRQELIFFLEKLNISSVCRIEELTIEQLAALSLASLAT